MEAFWEEKHKNNDNYWLTGSTPENVLGLHKIDLNISGKKILDLGVGKGNLAHHLFSNKNEVFCCDISSDALEKVKNISKTYLTTDLDKIEPVDIGICNLVFQHCTDEEVQRIINDIKLKDDGFFSFQFAFLRENEEPNETVKSLMRGGTHYFRPLDKIKDMVIQANKKVIYVSDPIHYYSPENFSWYIVRIMNNTT
jgi:SAM-dependent methyltransferase